MKSKPKNRRRNERPRIVATIQTRPVNPSVWTFYRDRPLTVTRAGVKLRVKVSELQPGDVFRDEETSELVVVV